MPERADLVLVAGWGLPARVWEPLRPWLEPFFRLHPVDLLADALTPEDMADGLMAQAPPRSQWLGWSLGGEIAILAAHRHPGRITRLHLWAANPCFVARPDYPDGMPDLTFQSFRHDFRLGPETAWRRFLALQCQGARQPRQVLRELQSLAGNALPAPAARLDRQLDWLENLDLRAELGVLPCPVQRLNAERDALMPVTAGQGLPGGAGVMPGEGHAFFLASPEAAARVLTASAGETS